MRHMTREQRAYDYVYDPVFTVSGRDLYRPAESQSSSHKTIQQKVNDPYKFYKRPVMANATLDEPGMKYVQATSVQSMAKIDEDDEGPLLTTERTVSSTNPSETLTRDMCTQSDYRESEAQTLPFEPEIRVTGNPECLLLTSLKCTDGTLPLSDKNIGEEQLKLIDRLRRRKKVIDNLPKNQDDEDFDQRLNMLKELEMTEWKEREEEIQKQQQERLDHIRKVLIHRERNREESDKQRIEKFTGKRVIEDLKNKLEKLQQRKVKQFRKIAQKHDNPEHTLIRRDLIDEYTFPASRTHVPILREGRGPESIRLLATTAELRPSLLHIPDTLNEIEKSATKKYLKPKKDPLATESQSKKQKLIQKDIAHAQQKVVEHKTNSIAVEKAQAVQTLRDLYRATPRLVRPSTPILRCDDEDDDEVEACIFVQKLLRGRAIEVTLAEGKEKAIALIKELQAVQDIKNAENASQKERNQELSAPETIQYEDVMDNIQGEVISKTLDYLSKELIRQEEMENIEKIMVEAEMERQLREEKEEGRRKLELEEQQANHIKYQQVVQVHDESIYTYLQDVIDTACKKVAEKEALKETIQHMKVEESRMVSTDETEVKNLVAQFLIPHVKRTYLEERVKKKFNTNLKLCVQL